MRLFLWLSLIVLLGIFVFYTYNSMQSQNKIVVFDMDETLGHFVQLGALYDIIKHITDTSLTQQYFDQLLDLYPNLLRPKIFTILEYVKQKKIKGDCSKVFIYTNNQGPKTWGQHIRKYFETKLDYPLFDEIIGAYKIRGLINDERRSTNKKTYTDVKTITNISDRTKICFLDDQYHEQMIHPNIFYIYLPDYKFIYNDLVMTEKFVNSSLANTLIKKYSKTELHDAIYKTLIKYKFTSDSNTSSTTAHSISNDTLDYLKMFFSKVKHNKTQKHRKNPNNKVKSRKRFSK